MVPILFLRRSCLLFLVGVGQFFFILTGECQHLYSDSLYFEEALKAKSPKESIIFCQKACEQAIHNRRFKVASNYCYRISKFFYTHGNYLPGIQQARAGLSIAHQNSLTRDTLTFKQYSLLASMYGRLLMSDSAAYWYAQSGNWLSRNPKASEAILEEVCGHYMNLGLFQSRMGDTHRAMDYLETALSIAQKKQNQRLVAIVYNYIGNIFYQTRQYDQADRYYRRALTGYRSGTVDYCWGYVILGNNARALGSGLQGYEYIQKGRNTYFELVAQRPEMQDNDFEIQSAYYKAEYLQVLRFYKEAEEAYQTCIRLHKTYFGLQGEFIAFSWISRGRIARTQHRIHDALAFANQGIMASCYRPSAYKTDPFGAIASEKTLYAALRLLAEVQQIQWETTKSVGYLINAVEAYDDALQVAARLRRNMIPEESKHFFSEKVAPCANESIRLCFDLYQKTRQEKWKNRLFELIEQSRVMTISDLLHEKYRKIKEIPSAVRVREQTLKKQKTELEKSFANTSLKETATRNQLMALLHNVNVQSYQFLDSLERTYPRYFALKYDFRVFTLQDVQRRLDKDMAYISYFVDNQHLVCLLVAQNHSDVVRIPLPPNFADEVQQLRQSLHTNPGMFAFSGQKQVNYLYNFVIRPIEYQIKPYERLVIARDGLLHYIPFEVLESDKKPGDLIGLRFAISYSYSSQITFEEPSAAPEKQPRVIGFAPFGLKQKSDSLRLIASLPEVRAWGGRIFADSVATKTAFLNTINQADVLLLATHALADASNPEKSFVAFHPAQSDSLLRAIEIINLPLSHLKLAILSACEGNEGVFKKAEGMLSLARAFRIAGCRSVVTTAWKAQSESTFEFSRLFQHYLLNGLPADVALQKVRQDFFAIKRLRKWSHPYYWSNFSLIGPPIQVYPNNMPYKWVIYALLVLITGGLVSLMYRWLTVIKPFQSS